MSTVYFINDGEIDLLSISSFGVSVKESKSPIGFFGTGLKYAIAVLLRHEQKVTAFIGKTEVKFSLVKKMVRDKEFNFVAMKVNGGDVQVLGFTTELGKSWELWMAYREIVCNAKDEGGGVTFLQNSAETGKTIFMVDGDKFFAIAKEAHKFILEDAADFQLGGVEVRNRKNHGFFYRGVKIQDFEKPFLHTYNETGFIELTEDRTAKNQSLPAYYIAKAISLSKDVVFLRKCLTASDAYMESKIDYYGWSGLVPSKEFLETVGKCYSENMTDVNKTAIQLWKDESHLNFQPKDIDLSKVQRQTLVKAIAFCKTIGFAVDKYPIHIVESLGSGTLGLALNDQIYIAEQVIALGGTKQLSSTLIEEYLHLRHGWKDCTRELQSFLFDKMVSLGEELIGEPL
jgi:hypothetical protein